VRLTRLAQPASTGRSAVLCGSAGGARGVEVGVGIDHVIDPHRPSTLADPVGCGA
jgi:hypothetical protein